MKNKLKTFASGLFIALCTAGIPGVIWAVWGSSAFDGLTTTVGAFSARLSCNGIENLFGVSQSQKKIPAITEITAPMNEYLKNASDTDGWAWTIDLAPDEIETPYEITPLPTPSEEILNAIPYPDSIEDNDGEILTLHYGTYTDSAYINLEKGGQVRNCTSVSNQVLKEASGELPDFNIELNSDQPQVLIYHTHTTESFEPYTRDYYDADFTCKTTDITMNMVAVGNEICEQLEAAGIRTLHDTTVHDYPSYNGSYQSSRQTVEEILEMYPSIKVVLDVHRDGIEREDGTRIAPITEIDGKRAAQIMIISCCDDGDGEIPLYMENFKLACLFQSQLEADYQGITRPILFDYRFYNQDLSTGSLLIEIGSHGNSIDEAKYSGELVGKSIAKALSGLSE